MNKPSLNRMLDVLDKKSAKKVFEKYLVENNLISEYEFVNKVMWAKFNDMWNDVKSDKLNSVQFRKLLEGLRGL